MTAPEVRMMQVCRPELSLHDMPVDIEFTLSSSGAKVKL